MSCRLLGGHQQKGGLRRNDRPTGDAKWTALFRPNLEPWQLDLNSDASAWRWVRTEGGVPPPTIFSFAFSVVFGIAFLVEVALSGGPASILNSLFLNPPGGQVSQSMIVWAFVVVLPIVLVVTALWVRPTWIGVGPAGVRVVGRLRDITVPWREVRPTPALPSRGWATFGRVPEWGRGGFFWATFEQAKVILAYPSAPIALFPPEFWRALGLAEHG